MHFKSWHIYYIRLNVKLAGTGRFWSFSLQFRLLNPWLILRVRCPCVAGEFAAPLRRQKTNKSALCIRLVVCCWPTNLSGWKFIYPNIRIFSPALRVLFAAPEKYISRNIYLFFLTNPSSEKYKMMFVMRREPINGYIKITANCKEQDFFRRICC